MRVRFVYFAALCGCAVADKASFQIGISQALQSIEHATFDRNSEEAGLSAGRKLFVEHLLKEVSEAPAEGDTRTALVTVSGILEDISGFIGGEKSADQTWYQGKLNAFTNCPNSSARVEDGLMLGRKQSALKDHYDCRMDDEKPKGEIVEKKCHDFFAFIHEAMGGMHADEHGNVADNQWSRFVKCTDWPYLQSGLNPQSPEKHLETKEKFKDMLYKSTEIAGTEDYGTPWASLKTFIYNRHTAVTDQKFTDAEDTSADCKSNFDEWKAINGCGLDSGTCDEVRTDGTTKTCSKLQSNYESEFCLFRYIRTRRCADLHKCYDEKERDFNAAKGDVNDRDRLRLRDQALIKYVKCIIDRLIANIDEDFETTNSSCRANLTADYGPGFGIVELNLTERDFCYNQTVTGSHPGDANWLQDEFVYTPVAEGATPIRENHQGAHNATNPVLQANKNDDSDTRIAKLPFIINGQVTACAPM